MQGLERIWQLPKAKVELCKAVNKFFKNLHGGSPKINNFIYRLKSILGTISSTLHALDSTDLHSHHVR